MKILPLCVMFILFTGAFLNVGLAKTAEEMSLNVIWRHGIGDGWVTSVALSSDGKTLAAGTSEGDVLVYSVDGTFWDYKTVGELVHVSISADGQFIAAGVQATSDSAGALYLFSKDSSTPIWKTNGGNYLDAEISADGKYIVGGSGNSQYTSNTVYLFEAGSSTPILSYHTANSPDFVGISSDGSYFVASDEKNIYLFSNTSQEPLWIYNIGYGPRTNVDITSDGKIIVAGVESEYLKYSGGYLLLFSKESNSPVWSTRNGGPFFDLSISSDSNNIAVIGNDGYVYSYQDRTFAYRYQVCLPPELDDTGAAYGTDVVVSPDGNYLASFSNYTVVAVFSKSSTTPVFKYNAESSLSSDGDGLAMASTLDGLTIAIAEFKAIVLLSPSAGMVLGSPLILVAVLSTVAVSIIVVLLYFRKRKRYKERHSVTSSTNRLKHASLMLKPTMPASNDVTAIGTLYRWEQIRNRRGSCA